MFFSYLSRIEQVQHAHAFIIRFAERHVELHREHDLLLWRMLDT